MSSQRDRDQDTTSAERPTARRKSDDSIAMEPTGAMDTAETNIISGSPQPAAVAAAFTPRSPVDRLRETPDLLEEGSRVGQYIIEAAHSRGGFATVYRATHDRIGRQVALKVLHSNLADTPNIVKRFEQEARAVNHIRHPNIVDITDYGELADGRPYFVMEWLDGATLKQLVGERGALSQDDALRLCEDILPALGAAHASGIIHRDLKLSNVIGVPRGDWFHFKLLDFGIAKVITPDGLTEGLMTTVTGNRVGSPMSMAPEQIRCQPVDPRTDIYAVGVMLFEVVTGKPPYRGKSPVEVEKLHLRAPVPDACEFAPVSPEVSAVIARCMQKKPDDRYASVDDVLADLRRAVADAPLVEAPKVKDIDSKQTGRPRRWLNLALLGVFLLAIVIFAAVRASGGDDDASDEDSPLPAGFGTGQKQPEPRQPTVAPHDGTITKVDGTFDPKTFDVTAGAALARKIARERYADAELFRIEADNVGGDGTADLTLGANALVMYKFRSPKRSAASAGDTEHQCLYYVYADRTRYYHYPVGGQNCNAPLLGVPTCSVAQVIGKARKLGLPNGARARLLYTDGDDRDSVWVVTSGTNVDVRFPDDCKK